MVPSDWEAHHLNGAKNPFTVRDRKAAIDVVVMKKGNLNFIIYPHSWVDCVQMVEWIDYVDRKFGQQVRFLNFQESRNRLAENVLGGQPLRAVMRTPGELRRFLMDLKSVLLTSVAPQ